jgi:hypothetical protein
VHKTTKGEDVHCLHGEGANIYRLVTECYANQHELFKSQDPFVTLDQMIRFVEAFADAFATSTKERRKTKPYWRVWIVSKLLVRQSTSRSPTIEVRVEASAVAPLVERPEPRPDHSTTLPEAKSRTTNLAALISAAE